MVLLLLLTNTLQDLGPWHALEVLDMACATGTGLRLLKQFGATKLIGVDISGEMLGVARSTPASNSFDLHHADCSKDIAHLGLRLGGFDVVLGTWLLNYPEDRKGIVIAEKA